jgi:tRNA(adenine34) deaminase
MPTTDDVREGVWRTALELAWEAYRAGTIPVGAVITDADGSVLATGRNRISDTDAPAGQIFGSRVAHGEINALVQLPVDRTYRECTLWTTLEPCAQCVAAAWISSIGHVRYAAADVYAGASKLVEREIEATDRVRTFPMTVEGPAVGATALLAELFVVSHFVERRPDHHVTDALRLLRPELVVLAGTVGLGDRVGLSLDAVEAAVVAAER